MIETLYKYDEKLRSSLYEKLKTIDMSDNWREKQLIYNCFLFQSMTDGNDGRGHRR